uniref:Uncharacterized protein n=1 Tax=Glossina pallidipes TaxID=7398 RepID=A0A1A9ZFE2_GLOPL
MAKASLVAACKTFGPWPLLTEEDREARLLRGKSITTFMTSIITIGQMRAVTSVEGDKSGVELISISIGFTGIAGQYLPMIEHTLWEGLAAGVRTFHKTWRGGYSRSIETTASGWNDLTASTMNGISMQSYIRARALKSSLELTSPLSMSSGKPSGIGIAFMIKRLCLLGDLDRHCWLDSSNTVSRYDTTGSDFLRGMQA